MYILYIDNQTNYRKRKESAAQLSNRPYSPPPYGSQSPSPQVTPFRQRNTSEHKKHCSASAIDNIQNINTSHNIQGKQQQITVIPKSNPINNANHLHTQSSPQIAPGFTPQHAPFYNNNYAFPPPQFPPQFPFYAYPHQAQSDYHINFNIPNNIQPHLPQSASAFVNAPDAITTPPSANNPVPFAPHLCMF